MPEQEALERNGDSSSLVVPLRGWDDEIERYSGLLEEVHAREPNADIFMPTYRKGLAHNEDPFQVASLVETRISEIHEASNKLSKPYKRIILIGYSMGALLIRKAYVYGTESPASSARFVSHFLPILLF